MDIKWIIFDAMGVIYTESDDVNSWVVPFIKEKNPRISTKDSQEVYRKAALGEITSTQFFEHYDIEDAFKAMYEYAKTKPKINEDFKEVASRLKQKYKIAMLSNDVDEWSRLLRKRFGLDSIFDKYIISGDCHICKPDKKMYIHTVNELDAMPEECLFIDDKTRNLLPPKDLGFNVLRFGSFDNGAEGIDSANNFKEVEEYVNSHFGK